jgi:hypothetical protein
MHRARLAPSVGRFAQKRASYLGMDDFVDHGGTVDGFANGIPFCRRAPGFRSAKPPEGR